MTRRCKKCQLMEVVVAAAVAAALAVAAAVAAAVVTAAPAVMAAITMVTQRRAAVTQISCPTCVTSLTTAFTDLSNGARVCHSSRIYR
jgi:hypothetical protein